MKAPERLAALAAAGVALVLAVLFASAAIRLGRIVEGFPIGPIRVVHRVTASLEVLTMLGVLWLAWRARAQSPGPQSTDLMRAATVAAALTVFLSVLGILAGQNPPPAAALGNLLGGLALVAAFAWILGTARRGTVAARKPLAHMVGAFLAVQCLLGAWISIFAVDLWTLPLLLHGFIGTGISCGVAWIALRCERALPRFALLGLSLAVPAAGFASALFGQPLGATLAHAAAVALLVAAAGYAHARRGPTATSKRWSNGY